MRFVKESSNYFVALIICLVLLLCFIFEKPRQNIQQNFINPVEFDNTILRHQVQALTRENNNLIELNSELRHKLFNNNSQ